MTAPSDLPAADPVPAASAGTARNRLAVGDRVPARRFATIDGGMIEIGYAADSLFHLQFRRFAGCPVCSIHLRSFVRREREIAAAGIREVVLFHSHADALRRHAGDLPFAVVADPERAHYRAFGVEAAPRALLDPRAWPGILRGVAGVLPDVLRGRRPMPPLSPDGGSLGLPADILVAPDGRVLARHYGAHANDQWSVDQVLALTGCRKP